MSESVKIGQKNRILIDKETGEEIEATQIFKRTFGQKNFWKIYLMDFLGVLGIFDSKQVDVFVYVLENTEEANNIFIGSQRDIAKNINVSLDTVSKIMRKLQQVGFIKQIKRGVYLVSADVMMRGSEHKRRILLEYEYRINDKE